LKFVSSVVIYRRWCHRKNGVYDVLPGSQFCAWTTLYTRS